MMNESQIEAWIKKTLQYLPEDLRQTQEDLEKNIRTALHKTFSRMDLVTREEFDTQAEVLSRTRATLEELEKQLQRLEEKLANQQQS